MDSEESDFTVLMEKVEYWKSPATELSELPQQKRSFVNACKKFHNEKNTAMWYHDSNEDRCSKFKSPHLHTIVRQHPDHQEKYAVFTQNYGLTNLRQMGKKIGGYVKCQYVHDLNALNRYLTTPPREFHERLLSENIEARCEGEIKIPDFDKEEDVKLIEEKKPKYDEKAAEKDMKKIREGQNEIMSRVIDYIMLTTNKYDYESINSEMNEETTPPNRLKMWRQLQVKPGIKTIITRTRDMAKARIQQVGLKQMAKGFMKRQMVNEDSDKYMPLEDTTKLYLNFCNYNAIVNWKFFSR